MSQPFESAGETLAARKQLAVPDFGWGTGSDSYVLSGCITSQRTGARCLLPTETVIPWVELPAVLLRSPVRNEHTGTPETLSPVTVSSSVVCESCLLVKNQRTAEQAVGFGILPAVNASQGSSMHIRNCF